MNQRIPLFLLTGFLGSGKTTLLNALLKQPQFARTLIIINEFGDVSLDHLLVAHSSEDNVIELSSGCICCSIRGDLAKTLLDISWRFTRHGKRQFDQVIIETTGMAAPGSIIHTVMAEPKIANQYRLQGIAVTVDAVNGANTLKRYNEARQQAALADLLLITKTDLATAEQTAQLKTQLTQLNPQAEQLTLHNGDLAAERLLQLDHIEPQESSTPLSNWLPLSRMSVATAPSAKIALKSPAQLPHSDNISSYAFLVDKPFNLSQLEQWFEQSYEEIAAGVLRMKGILHVDGFPGPVVIHGVQHLFHPAEFMSHWPDDDKRSRLVFITDGISRQQIEQHLLRSGILP